MHHHHLSLSLSLLSKILKTGSSLSVPTGIHKPQHHPFTTRMSDVPLPIHQHYFLSYIFFILQQTSNVLIKVTVDVDVSVRAVAGVAAHGPAHSPPYLYLDTHYPTLPHHQHQASKHTQKCLNIHNKHVKNIFLSQNLSLISYLTYLSFIQDYSNHLAWTKNFSSSICPTHKKDFKSTASKLQRLPLFVSS